MVLPGRVLTIWRLLHMLRHFDPPFSGLWKICIVSTLIFEEKWGKCRISTPIFGQNLAKCIVSTPIFRPLSHFESSDGAEHPYPKPNREPPPGWCCWSAQRSAHFIYKGGLPHTEGLYCRKHFQVITSSCLRKYLQLFRIDFGCSQSNSTVIN